MFATAIAKYFRNAIREAILLQVCDAGIVFLPGAAGTVQEVFQDACENYYAAETSVAPMVLVGAHVLDRDAARLAAAAVAGPRPADGGARAPGRHRRRGRRADRRLVDDRRRPGRPRLSGLRARRPADDPAEPLNPTVSGLGRGELAAGAVDLAAAGVADGGRDAARLEAAYELALVGRVGGGPLRAGRGVERDQVDVHPAPVAAGERGRRRAGRRARPGR